MPAVGDVDGSPGGHRLAVIGGDGIGPEVVDEALKVLDRLEQFDGFRTQRTDFDLGVRRYLATGEALDDATLEELREFDALHLGAVGRSDVPPGVLGHGLLLRIRSVFDQYVNLRPVKLYLGVPTPIVGLTPERCNFVVVRENTKSAYAGAGGTLRAGTPAEVATQESVNSFYGVERVLRYAFELARQRRGHLTLVHKTNVLTHAGRLWTRVVTELDESTFGDVRHDYLHVDAACLHLITEPQRFDVIVTENLFGDIITDVGAALQGGLGRATAANLYPTCAAPSMFETVHGSAPDIAGTGRANPIAAVMSLGHLLSFIGEQSAAARLDRAVSALLSERGDRRLDGARYCTTDVGDRLVELLPEH